MLMNFFKYALSALMIAVLAFVRDIWRISQMTPRGVMIHLSRD